MSTHENRRAELIAAAVAGDLTGAGEEELAAISAADPGIDIEIAELRIIVGRLSDAPPRLPWDDIEPSAGLERRVLSSTVAPVRRRARRKTWAAAAAVAAVAVGAGAVLGFEAVMERPVTGPPGTLGAFEQIAFTGAPSGVEIEGGLVAHTWGTETVLEMDGIPGGRVYEVVVLEQSGAASSSGTFLGSSVTIECRMNAAVLREDVGSIEIRAEDGSVLATAGVADTA